MFQDSHGSLWFATLNGAFKLEGDLLVHIDKIISYTTSNSTITLNNNDVLILTSGVMADYSKRNIGME